MLYADWLAQAGFRVAEAHNGLQALERALDLIPAVIVTDLNIPGIDGYELTRRLRSDPRTSGIPILAVTGYAPFTQDPSRADRAGCDAILSKPCSPEDLESTVKILIEGSRGARPV
jgi:two-component system cell cycle response regulator DivK